MKILIALLMALTSCTTAQQSPLTVTDPFGTFRLPDPRLGNENDVAQRELASWASSPALTRCES